MTRPTPRRVLFVHGINTPPDEPLASPVAALLRSAGLDDVEVYVARWLSTGGFTHDCLEFATSILGSTDFRDRAVREVATDMQTWLAGGDGVIVSHSMGTVLALEVARRRFFDGDPPGRHVFLASPLSNPLILPALQAVELARPVHWQIPHLWNQDDPICCSPIGAKNPPYLAERRIAVPDNIDGDDPHALRHYLTHPHVISAIRFAFDGGES